MNIFFLSMDPVEAAKMQCDKHIVKMPTESAQMLSTVHRMLDGKKEKRPSKSGKRMIDYWVHPTLDDQLYKVVHQNHPCTVWTMESLENYYWHYQHFIALCVEYQHRYGRTHACFSKLGNILAKHPKNIVMSRLLTTPKLAMKANPECMFPENPVKSYRLFYQTKQDRFKMIWTNREIPEWFERKTYD